MKKFLGVMVTLFFVSISIQVYAAGIPAIISEKGIVRIKGDINIDSKTNGCVFALDGRINVSEEVSGDVIAVFGDIAVNSNVKGKVVSIFGNITLSEKAQVGNDILAVAGNIYTDSKNQGQILCILGNVEIGNSAGVQEDVTNVFGRTEVRNSIGGNLTTINGTTKVNAKIYGDATLLMGKMDLAGDSYIGGSFFAIGSIKKDSSVRIAGQNISLDINNTTAVTALLAISYMIISLVSLLIGILMITLLKERFFIMDIRIEENMGRKMKIGFMAILMFFTLSLVLIFTFVFPIVFVILCITSEAVTGIFVGRLLTKFFVRKQNIYIEYISGLVLFTFAKLLLIITAPHLGYVVSGVMFCAIIFLVNSLGCGTLISTRFGSVECLNAVK